MGLEKQTRGTNAHETAVGRIAEAFVAHRERLLALVKKNLNPILLKRMSHEDVLQSAYEAAARRPDYFAAAADVPIYFKLRTIVLQTLADIARRHLQAGRRDAYKEDSFLDRAGETGASELAADVPSPVSQVDRDERHALLRRAVAALSETDRQVIVLRHFDGLGNGACAEVLGLEPKAASIRYVRALERLQKKLTELSCFGRGTVHGNA